MRQEQHCRRQLGFHCFADCHLWIRLCLSLYASEDPCVSPTAGTKWVALLADISADVSLEAYEGAKKKIPRYQKYI